MTFYTQQVVLMLFRALIISNQAQCAPWLQRLVFPFLLVAFFINVETFMENTCVGREKTSRQIFWRIRNTVFQGVLYPPFGEGGTRLL